MGTAPRSRAQPAATSAALAITRATTANLVRMCCGRPAQRLPEPQSLASDGGGRQACEHRAVREEVDSARCCRRR